MNLLYDPIFETGPDEWRSLPGVLAAMARGDVSDFPGLRPHQRAAWHSFLVFLAALALWHDGRRALPETEQEWCALILALTDGDAVPWRLFAPDDGVGFMQVPRDPKLNWTRVETPDLLDMLITSRNHDLKQSVAMDALAQTWVYALISLQTSEGYGGAGQQGIARMNGGSSSRAMLAYIPGVGLPNPSQWWRRDVLALLTLRDEGEENAPGTVGGAALLWCKPWNEGAQLDLPKLDPWFIEICRRVRLQQDETGIYAERAGSKAARIDAKAYKGVTGDPWAPVSNDKAPKSLTLGEGDFSYKRMTELLWGEDWHVAPLADPQWDEGDGMILAEAIGRGNSKTYGFQSRLIPVPGAVRVALGNPETGKIAKEQIEEIAGFSEAIRNALALMAAGGDREKLGKDHYARARPARAAFDMRADDLFFPALWRRVMAQAEGGPVAAEQARKTWLQDLHRAAFDELHAAMPAIPVAQVYRPRSETRAKRAYWVKLGYLKYAKLLNKGNKDGA